MPSQLGITQIQFQDRLNTWDQSAADASKINNRLEAQQRILEAQTTNAETLNLSGLNLTEVPPLDASTQLKILNLSKNQ